MAFEAFSHYAMLCMHGVHKINIHAQYYAIIRLFYYYYFIDFDKIGHIHTHIQNKNAYINKTTHGYKSLQLAS